jgi:hypothetical protein
MPAGPVMFKSKPISFDCVSFFSGHFVHKGASSEIRIKTPYLEDTWTTIDSWEFPARAEEDKKEGSIWHSSRFGCE